MVHLDLADNRISDLSPLVDVGVGGPGGSGECFLDPVGWVACTTIELGCNPIDEPEQAASIEALEWRGVDVSFCCP